MNDLLSYLDRNKDRFLSELTELLAIPRRNKRFDASSASIEDPPPMPAAIIWRQRTRTPLQAAISSGAICARTARVAA